MLLFCVVDFCVKFNDFSLWLCVYVKLSRCILVFMLLFVFFLRLWLFLVPNNWLIYYFLSICVFPLNFSKNFIVCFDGLICDLVRKVWKNKGWISVK